MTSPDRRSHEQLLAVRFLTKEWSELRFGVLMGISVAVETALRDVGVEELVTEPFEDTSDEPWPTSLANPSTHTRHRLLADLSNVSPQPDWDDPLEFVRGKIGYNWDSGLRVAVTHEPQIATSEAALFRAAGGLTIPGRPIPTDLFSGM